MKVNFEPKHRGEATRHPSWPIWKTAENSEVTGLVDNCTFRTSSLQDLPSDVHIDTTMFTYKDKDDRAKARLCFCGDSTGFKPSKLDTIASTPHPTTIRTFFAHAAQQGNIIWSADISQAFIQSDDPPWVPKTLRQDGTPILISYGN